MHRDAVIPTFQLSTGTTITQTSPWQTLPVTPESPALDVMTDLTKVKAATIHPDQTLRQAEQTMIYQGVRMLFVVNEMPVLQGLITSTDLHSERQMSLVHSRHLRFDEMRVADVMSALSMLDAIALDSMRIATVSNLIATLRSLGRNHLLVMQAGAPGAAQQVRGVISRAQIERQLGQPVEVAEELAGNFAEVVRALH
ncbi:MAG TPA: CBS domain-containing protein [Caldimonas sp.]|jgi:CBS-domain-containing membrane protein